MPPYNLVPITSDYKIIIKSINEINSEYCRYILNTAQGQINRKITHLKASSWMLHHDKARPHIADVFPMVFTFWARFLTIASIGQTTVANCI